LRMPLTRTLFGETLPGQPCPKFHLQTISDGSWAPFHSDFPAGPTPADTRQVQPFGLSVFAV
jgi:hypothetical protein